MSFAVNLLVFEIFEKYEKNYNFVTSNPPPPKPDAQNGVTFYRILCGLYRTIWCRKDTFTLDVWV